MEKHYNSHLNPAPYPTSPRVKFHIQNEKDIEGVAICGGIYDSARYMVFSASFVHRMDKSNQCQCCIKEFERAQKIEENAFLADFDELLSKVLAS